MNFRIQKMEGQLKSGGLDLEATIQIPFYASQKNSEYNGYLCLFGINNGESGD